MLNRLREDILGYRPSMSKNKKMKQQLFEVLPYDSEEFKEAWSDWVQHRAWMKEPVGPIAAKRQLKFLKTLGEADAVKSIENSITHNWTGLFPPKSETIVIQSRWNGKKYGQ
jgi:hypothetical protein